MLILYIPTGNLLILVILISFAFLWLFSLHGLLAGTVSTFDYLVKGSISMHKEDHIADLIKAIALIAGKNSFLTGAVARFRRVKYIRMARIQEQLPVFSRDRG